MPHSRLRRCVLGPKIQGRAATLAEVAQKVGPGQIPSLGPARTFRQGRSTASVTSWRLRCALSDFVIIADFTVCGLIRVNDWGRALIRIPLGRPTPTTTNPGDPYHAAVAPGSGSHSSRPIGAASRSAAASRASAPGRSIWTRRFWGSLISPRSLKSVNVRLTVSIDSPR